MLREEIMRTQTKTLNLVRSKKRGRELYEFDPYMGTQYDEHNTQKCTNENVWI
jgi:hypothetical protein